MASVMDSIGGDLKKRLGVDKKKAGTYWVIIDRETCIKCGQCTAACTPGAIEMNDDDVSLIPKKCTRCGLCAEACPVGAIKIKS